MDINTHPECTQVARAHLSSESEVTCRPDFGPGVPPRSYQPVPQGRSATALEPRNSAARGYTCWIAKCNGTPWHGGRFEASPRFPRCAHRVLPPASRAPPVDCAPPVPVTGRRCGRCTSCRRRPCRPSTSARTARRCSPGPGRLVIPTRTSLRPRNVSSPPQQHGGPDGARHRRRRTWSGPAPAGRASPVPPARWRIVSTPSMRGMRRSIRTTSGDKSTELLTPQPALRTVD
jgi:hypothetical protein